MTAQVFDASEVITEEDLLEMDEEARDRLLVALQRAASAPVSLRDTYRTFSRPNPQGFIKEVLQETVTEAATRHGIVDPWTPDQASIMDAVSAAGRDYKHIAIYSGNGTGKSYILARIALWALFEQEDTIVISTAPNAAQVEEVLWGEIRQAYQRSGMKLPGRQLLTKITLGEKWYATGYTAHVKKGDSSATAFQGRHSTRIVVIIDEATDVPDEVWAAAERMAMRPGDKIIAIGNPTDPSSRFARVKELRRPDGSAMWHTITVSGEDHPNVVYGDADIIPGAVTVEFCEDILHESGSKDSAVYRSAVLGLFPTENPDALISLTWYTQAQQRYETTMARGGPAVDRKGVALGLDVAGEGSDLTVLSSLEDGVWGLPKLRDRRAWHQGRDTTETVDLCMAALNEIPNVRVLCLDDTAIGSAVRAELMRRQREGKIKRYKTTDGRERPIWILPVNFGRLSTNPRFDRLKDECWWGLRESLRDAKDLSIPTEQVMATWELPRRNSLRSQVTVPIYQRVGQGVIQVYDKRHAHGKKEITKNLPTKSPDLAHSLMLANYAWRKLKADKSARPVPTTMDELFNAKMRESIEKSIDSERRKKRDKPGGKRGPKSPYQS